MSGADIFRKLKRCMNPAPREPKDGLESSSDERYQTEYSVEDDISVIDDDLENETAELSDEGPLGASPDDPTDPELIPSSSERPEVTGLAGGAEFCVFSHVNGRENNEDSLVVFQMRTAPDQPETTVLAIADGMGGHAFGEEVSREALLKLTVTLFEEMCARPSVNRLEPAAPIDVDSVKKTLESGLEVVSSHIRRMVESNHWGKAGSTLTVVIVRENEAIAANLGDSPLYFLSGSSDEIRKISEDHTVAAALVKGGLITPEMERFHEARHALEFFAGGASLPRQPFTYIVPLRPGDLLLVCSDGVSGSQTIDELSAAVGARGDSLEEIGNRLIQASLAAGETDNQTFILWRHGDANPVEKHS